MAPIISDDPALNQLELIAEDFENRCDWHFPDSLERCWLMPIKTVRMRGGREMGKFCGYHYELGLKMLAQQAVMEGKDVKEK